MKFEDIPTRIVTVRVKGLEVTSEELREEPVFQIAFSPVASDILELRLQGRMVQARLTSEADCRSISSELSLCGALLATMTNISEDASFDLQVATFTGETLEMGDEVGIGVDEYVIRGLQKILGRKSRSQDEISTYLQELEERMCYQHGDQHYFFLYAGESMNEVCLQSDADHGKEEGIEEDTEEDVEQDEEVVQSEDGEDWESMALTALRTKSPSFCVNGHGLRFVASERVYGDSKSIYVATRLTPLGLNVMDRALRLASGRLCFSDFSKTGEMSLLAREQLRQLTSAPASYLKKWDEYGNVEGNLMLERARNFGAVHYDHFQANSDGTCTVSLCQATDAALQMLSNGEVESVSPVGDELPDYLTGEVNSYEDYCKKVLQTSPEQDKRGRQAATGCDNSYDVDRYDKEARELRLKQCEWLAPSGCLVLSLAGEMAQVKRRNEARRKILEGRSANPQLGVLIEQGGKVTHLRQQGKVKALTGFVRKKVFRNEPTLKQEEAIDVALNTPDIAMIQGPPGTGKTTVIAAILERLNEMSDKRGSSRGRVLLTGFQHDAVENMIDRLTINSLPVPKYGNRSGAAQENQMNASEQKLLEWCRRVAQDIRRTHTGLERGEHERNIRDLYQQYVRMPSHSLSVTLVQAIVDLGGEILKGELYRQAKALCSRLEQEKADMNSPEPSRTLAVIRDLRTSESGFLDDGPERAMDVLEALGEELTEEDRKVLQEAADYFDEPLAELLPLLRQLKRRLLIRHTASPVFAVEKRNEEVMGLVQQTLEAIREHGYTSKDKATAILLDFLEGLEQDPFGMLDAVSDYSFAFAATCQHSVNRRMQQAKLLHESGENNLEYDYVIVDEAARVSPRDLMIPMVQGRKIILVGDHRQLPHILNEEVARRMEQGEESPGESEWLKKSMFEYLFSERLKELERLDGIRRTVTLDRQYRMHPLLGDFISKNFYERFSPGERFGSGLSAERYRHDLPGTDNRPAAWLEVEATRGSYTRSGTSLVREIEARAIANQLEVWLSSEQGKNLSYGVISFYKAQADGIRSFLNRHVDERQVKIGTVDSFQGMEFDVVFLSMVRTSLKGRSGVASAEEELKARRLFGHLCLYNRLNVAMSRQKRLLVVVGDSGLLRHELAPKYIPGLVNFYKLCQESGVMLSCGSRYGI